MILVEPKDIDAVEDQIKPLLKKACEDHMSHVFVTVDDYIDSMKEGRRYLFVTDPIEFIVVFQFEIVNEKKRLILLFCAGKNYKKHVDEGMQTLLDFAEIADCSEIISYVRLGITKDLFRWGFSENKYKHEHKEVFKVIGDSQTSSAGR